MFAKAFHSESISDLSFLITGGAGFIGSNLADYLMLHGARRVVVLDNLFNGKMHNIEAHTSDARFTFIKGDITNPETCMEACKGIDIVFHQAAVGSVPRSIKDPLFSHLSNVDGFLNMLIAARDNKVRRMVYASSSSVYGDSPKMPKQEMDLGRLLSPYAVTKKINELYADVFYLNYGLETIGLRYFNVYGPKQDPNGPYAAVIPLFIQSLLDGKAPTINGDGSQTRDFTFVADAVQANVKAAFSKHPQAVNKVYNVAYGSKIALIELYQNLQALSGVELPAHFGPYRQGDIKDSLADISQAKENLGYQPVYFVKDGLRFAFDWYKTNTKK